MKIAIIDMDNPKNPHWGTGQARATREIFRRLATKHKITVHCSKYPGWKNYSADGIKYVHHGLCSNYSQLNNLAFILTVPSIVRSISKSAVRVKPDVIVECFNAPISTSFAPLFTKIPLIGYATIFEAPFFAKKYHLPFDLVEKFGCRFYAYFVGLSQAHVDKMKSFSANVTAKIIPEGVSEDYFTIKRRKAKHILFVGRYDMNQKGIDLLLNAYFLKKRSLQYPLVLVGFGPDEKKIQKRIEQLGLQKQVTVFGGAFGETKKKLLSEAIAVAFSSRFEGFSLFALEALASGLPIVCFDIPAMVWTTKEVALKAKPFNVKKFAENLVVVQDQVRNKKMSKAARQLAKRYTWNAVSEQFGAFFNEVTMLEKQKVTTAVLEKQRAVAKA